VGTLEGVPQGELRLALLRRVTQPLVGLVLDVDLREPGQDGRVPAAEGSWLVRSARYVAWLAWRRLRRRDSGAVVTALGLTVAAAILAGIIVGGTIAADRATAHEVERMPAAERSVRAVWFGVPATAADAQPALDGKVQEALPDLTGAGPTELVLFRESTVAGRFVGIAGVDGLEEHVILRSGRLPRRCTPARCEVLRLRGRGTLPDAPGLRLVEVGTATLVSRQLFGDFLPPTDEATADAEVAPALRESGRYHRPAPAPLVAAEGVEALAASPALSRVYRTYAWVWPLAPGSPRLWEVDALLGRVERARAELAEVSSGFAIDAPEEELRTAERRADVAAERLLLVGGEAAALLLAFALLAARSLRRDVLAAHVRLTWYGARPWQLGVLTGVESALVAVGGVVLGWLVGSAAGAVAAFVADAPAWRVLRESTLSATGLAVAVASALLAAGLVALAVSLRPRDGARLGLPEAVAGAALIVIGLALLEGALDEDRLARGGDTALLLLLVPGLVALVGAVVVARLVPAAARLVADRPRTSVSARLVALGLARGPGAAIVTASFLTIAFGLAILAEGYRATLARGEREQAAYQVPLDVTVREDLGSLVRVFDAASLERYRALAGAGGAAYPVLRVSASAGRIERVTGVTVLGLDRPVFKSLVLWRPEWAGGAGRGDVAELVDPSADIDLRGATLPEREVEVMVGPGIVGLAAVVETPAGDFRRVDLGRARLSRASTLAARVPPGSRLVSLEILPPRRLIEGGADAGIAYEGTVHLDGPLGGELATWVGVDGATVRPASKGIDVDFVLTPQRVTRLRAPQATDESPPQVLATPLLAEVAGGVGGTLPVRVGGSVVPVQVAGVVERFPGTSGDVVVGDRGALATAINAAAPGSARENEVWLDLAATSTDAVESAFSERPLDVLAMTTRAELEADARRDPLARGTLLALGSAALLALALAAIGLALAVRSDLRDDQGELYELEALGAPPSLLRRVVRSRALAVALAGLLAGIVVGLVLVRLVTRMVSVTARGGFAEPPLIATVDIAVIAAGIAAFALVSVLLVGMTTRSAFAEARGPASRGGI
jgi:FtsX-like permease family